MEKEVEIYWKDDKISIMVGELTWAQEKKIRLKSIILKDYKGQPMQFRDTDLADDLRILTQMVDPPFEKIMSNLGKLKPRDRNKLLLACLEVDNVIESKTEERGESVSSNGEDLH